MLLSALPLTAEFSSPVGRGWVSDMVGDHLGMAMRVDSRAWDS